MNKFKINCFLIVNLIILKLLFFQNLVIAQESLVGLNSNPSIKAHLINNQENQKANKSLFVKLPFLDDFSSTYVFPNTDKYVDNNVFINDGFGINPVSMSVATFDAFNNKGEIYEQGGTFPFVADYLTSLFVRLDTFFVGTPRRITLADSLYFSFYYQPQGRGDKPETTDSLVLQFFNPTTNNWNTVWSSHGMSFNDFKAEYGVDFKAVMIPITNNEFLSENFRFRFYNVVSLANNIFPTWAGNVDNWNIDYINLNVGRNINDSLPVDVTFRDRQYTLLKNYHSMPWNQFLVNPSAEMKTNVKIPYTNFSNVLVNLTERFQIKDISETTPVFNSPVSASNVPAFTDTFFIRNPLNYTFNSNVTKNAEFEVRFVIHTATINDLIRTNDTMFFYQRFYNFYAYDDGTPESGYALVGKNAQLAYKFNLNKPDTLHSIMIQFNRVQNNTNENLFFSLRVWNNQGGKPNNVIYEQQGLRPITDGLFGFTKYELTQPLILNAGTFYIGWIQQEEDALNIGFDRNNINNANIFFNVNGTWFNSMLEGSLMMRPVFGNPDPFVQVEENNIKPNFRFFPNPLKTNETIQIETNTNNFSVLIYSLQGKLLHSSENNKSIDVNLSSGIYLLTFIDNETNNSIRCKLVVTK